MNRFDVARPVDLMDNAKALPTTPQAPQPKQKQSIHLLPKPVISECCRQTVCSLAGLDEEGRVVFRKRVRRDQLSGFLANVPPSTVAMEACCGAHHAAREALALGHEARLMPPEYVRPYVKAQKTGLSPGIRCGEGDDVDVTRETALGEWKG